ncbi:UNVERIFIED_CONTAM: hypothetical protein Slati_3677100 [Sesamum latifolium]|uniref:Uncharacterized protein n=1 Tax=Sesamum latifolium TaxID=2727402 RepID=A0AAW2U190_9LAMI
MSKVWSLQATNHRLSNEPSILPTLGQRIIKGKSKWGDDVQFTGEFRYIKGFWEWTEDILSRCEQKLVAAQVYDSAYALLFTYDRNSEVIKAFCEACRPCAKELDGADETGRSAEEALFSKLGIEGNLKEETFLAVYLACWLCTFALPTDGVGSIRPSTFKVASIMALSKSWSCVPVLTSIYKGVRGPKMTLFSGEGGAKYYDPQEARKRIHKGDFISWTCNMIAKDKDFSFVDDGRAKDFEEPYFMAIRSNYLPLRQGDYFDVEPYSPHRFARQFGFFQELPGFFHKMFVGRL